VVTRGEENYTRKSPSNTSNLGVGGYGAGNLTGNLSDGGIARWPDARLFEWPGNTTGRYECEIGEKAV